MGTSNNKMKKAMCLIGIMVGIAAIIVGCCVMNPETYTLGKRDAFGSLIEFGADFYTEIYHMTYQVGHQAQKTYVNICNAIGWLIVVLGAFDVCYFGVKMFDTTTSVIKNEHNTEEDELPDL